jgi:hypothetical protein
LRTSAVSGCDRVSDDLVRAEAHAARALRHGVERYAEHIRGTAAHARREVAAADRNAQEAVERCRSELRHREEELKRAQAALTQCLRSPRSDCSRLRQQADAAAQRHTEARQRLERARQAAQITSGAQSDLIKALQAVGATVGEHSSVASSALASLDAKLAGLPRLDADNALSSARLAVNAAPKSSGWLHQIAAEAVVTAEVLGASLNLGPVAGDAGAAVNVNLPARDHSITEMAERQTQQEIDYAGERAAEEAERARSDHGSDTVP